jgi:hypothetical protein
MALALCGARSFPLVSERADISPNGAWRLIRCREPSLLRSLRNAEAGGVTLQEVEARLRREPELDKLEPDVVEALARAVMRFLE